MPPVTMHNAVFRAESGLATNRPVDMEPMLHMLEETRNPSFERILRKIAKKVAKSRMKFEWRYRRIMPRSVKVTVVDAVGQSHIEVDNFAYVHRDDLLYNTRTKELYLANFTPTSGGQAPDATVDILSYPTAGTLQTATAVGDVINILTESHAEGEDLPEYWSTVPTADFDYIMQIDRRSAEISDVAEAEAEYDPRGQRALDNKLAMIELMQGLNLLFYLSQSTRETTSASGPRRHALGGMRQKIVTNRMDVSGVPGGLTPQMIGELLRKTKYQGRASENKSAMIGQYALQAVSSWPVGAVQVSPREKQWGYNIKTIITPHGNLDLMYDHALTEDHGLADVLVIFDPAHVRQTYLRTLGMKVIKKVANLSTTHKIVDAVTTTAGLQLYHEELHAWLEGIG